MSVQSIRAVFDCVVFLQGAGRRTNAARKCLELVDQGIVELCLSADVLAEIDDVLRRPEIRNRFPLIRSEDSQLLLRTVRSRSVLLADIPNAFSLPRDADDEAYLDLAIAAQAKYLVTWNDRHLTYLMRRDTPEGVEFCERFPGILIVDPPGFLESMRKRGEMVS